MSAPTFWHWPDKIIRKRESRRLREEHNAVSNALAKSNDVLGLLVAAANANRTNLSRPMGDAIAAARAILSGGGK